MRVRPGCVRIRLGCESQTGVRESDFRLGWGARVRLGCVRVRLGSASQTGCESDWDV
jgi:hypothetical protein